MSFAEDGEQPGVTATATPDSETPGAPSELGDETTTPAAESAEEVQAEAPESPEGAEPPVADQTPAPLPEGWQDHPEAEPVFKEREDRSFNNGRGVREKELRKEMGRREQRTDTERAEAFKQGAAIEVVKDVRTAIERAAQDPEVGSELGKVIRDNAGWADIFTGAHIQAAELKWSEEVESVIDKAGLSDDTMAELGNLRSEIKWKVRHAEITQAQGSCELIEASLEHIKALGAQKEKERRDGLEREMTGAADRAGKRQKQPPPAAPGGSGAGSDGRTDRELQLDPTTPVEKLREIEARQAAGG